MKMVAMDFHGRPVVKSTSSAGAIGSITGQGSSSCCAGRPKIFFKFLMAAIMSTIC